MRLAASATIAMLVLIAMPARATVTFVVTELSGCSATPSRWDCLGAFPQIGQPITIGMRVTSDPNENVYGIGASIYGYAEAGMSFVDGSAVTSLFHVIAIPGLGAYDGIPNLVGSAPLRETSIGSNPRRVLLVNAVDLAPHSENPLDPGLDGVIGGGGDQIRVRLQAVGLGGGNISIGTEYNGDGVVYSQGRVVRSTSAIISLTANGIALTQLPEPGTALLLGLGLAGLASLRRRSGE